MKLKTLSILVILAVAIIIPIACNADNVQSKEAKSKVIVNSENPGEELDITKFLVKGKINIVDFYSEYCPPCRRWAPILTKLDKKREDIIVLKVDINRPGKRGIDWGSPLAAQYGLRSIPHFKIYDTNGKLLSEGREAGSKVQNYVIESKIE